MHIFLNFEDGRLHIFLNLAVVVVVVKKSRHKKYLFLICFFKVDMRNILGKDAFSKVDTGNIFCRNPFSKVDTMTQRLAKPLFTRDSGLGWGKA